MLSGIGHWWTYGEEDAVAVYRARLMGPLVLLTVVVGAVYLSTFLHPKGADLVLVIFWTVGAILIGLRRRRAAIFTVDTFIYRPVFGEPLRIPFGAMRSAMAVDWGSHEEYPIPTIRIEFIVGGSVDIPLGVAKAGEVVRRIAESARD